MPVLSIRAAVEMLSINNNALHNEVNAIFTIYPNRLVRNEYNYKSIEIYLS
jgi:hypothetical protein